MNPEQQIQPLQPEVQQPTTPSKRGRYDGRINRLGFFLGHVITYGIGFALVLVMLLAYALTNFLFKGSENTGDMFASNPVHSIINVMFYVSIIFYVIFMVFTLFSLYIRRLHDINVTGWVSVLLLINPVNFVLYIVLQAVEGTEGDNKYGMPERPTTVRSILGIGKR